VTHPVYPAPSGDLAARRAELAPATQDAFEAFSSQVFAEGALSEKTKQLIAVAVAHVRSHTRLAQRKGAGDQEIMEAIWVAAEMRAGGAYAHSMIALEATAQRGEGNGR
jgi:AhpD family alkylhydroperoxidase